MTDLCSDSINHIDSIPDFIFLYSPASFHCKVIKAEIFYDMDATALMVFLG